MADLSKGFGAIRIAILVSVTIFSVIVLIMGGLVRGYVRYSRATFAIAISIITLLSIPVMIFLSTNRKGALPSMIVVEISYIGVLWVLWLAVSVIIIRIHYDCYYDLVCRETRAMKVFSFLNWLLLMLLNVFLLSLASIQANRGNSAIWTSFVTEVNYSAPGPASSAQVEAKDGQRTPASPATPNTQYPQPVPTPQQTFPLQQTFSLQQTFPLQQMYTFQPQHPSTPMLPQV